MRTRWAVVTALVVLSGCSAGNSDTLSSPTQSAPPMAGPWAPLMQDEYRKATSDMQRRVLADGSITESEVAELKSKFSACMEGKGLKVNYTTAGGFDVAQAGSQGEAHDAVKECSTTTSGHLVDLYYAMGRNPANQDELTIVSACLVKKGVRPVGYSATDYERDMSRNPPAAFLDGADARACLADPLGLATKK